MLETGISRRIDELGRFVIPKELRNTLGIDNKDPLELFIHGDQIVLRKYQRGCIFCNQMDSINQFRGHIICDDCVKNLQCME
jgi:AbrB family transcriptional regulator, transcriptional pleiotropic regulator of transition state genes